MSGRHSPRVCRSRLRLPPIQPEAEQFGAQVYIRRREVDANPLPDQTVLLFQKDTSLAVPVNQTGAAIWQMCDGAHSVDQIVDKLAEEYDQERPRIERDAQAFLSELIRLGFVETELPRL